MTAPEVLKVTSFFIAFDTSFVRMMAFPLQWVISWKLLKFNFYKLYCSQLLTELVPQLIKRYSWLFICSNLFNAEFVQNKQHFFRCFLLQLLNPFQHYPLFASWLAVVRPHVLQCSTLISDKRSWGMLDYSTTHSAGWHKAAPVEFRDRNI